jgi:hypothetical protein
MNCGNCLFKNVGIVLLKNVGIVLLKNVGIVFLKNVGIVLLKNVGIVFLKNVGIVFYLEMFHGVLKQFIHELWILPENRCAGRVDKLASLVAAFL